MCLPTRFFFVWFFDFDVTSHSFVDFCGCRDETDAEGRNAKMKMKWEREIYLHNILPDLRHLGEELQREYQAYHAEAARCDAAVFHVPLNQLVFFLDSRRRLLHRA